jgi:hypothetical protein
MVARVDFSVLHLMASRLERGEFEIQLLTDANAPKSPLGRVCRSFTQTEIVARAAVGVRMR